jgi:hypothetical protein
LVFLEADITIGRRIEHEHWWSMAEGILLGNEADNEAAGT